MRFSSSTTSVTFFECGRSSLCIFGPELAQSIMAVDPFSSNIAVSTQLNRRSFLAGVDGSVGEAQYPWYFAFSVFSLFSPVCCRMFDSLQRKS